jgi:hypothetical protein
MRALAPAATVVVGVLVASGCARAGANDVSQVRTAISRSPHRLVVPQSQKSIRANESLLGPLFLAPTRLAIPGILGSSNCPSVPAKLIVIRPHAIRIDLVVGSWSRTASGLRVQVPRSPGLCLDDLHPVPVVIAINPRQIDVHHTLKVNLYYPKDVIRRFRRPVVVFVPPIATSRIREEVRVARSSNPLFSIFPAVPGERRCAIHNGARPRRPYQGICRTSVHSRPTHEPSVSVSFTEIWGLSCLRGGYCPASQLARHHTWQVIEGEPVVTQGAKLHVFATDSRGARAPQDYR